MNSNVGNPRGAQRLARRNAEVAFLCGLCENLCVLCVNQVAWRLIAAGRALHGTYCQETAGNAPGHRCISRADNVEIFQAMKITEILLAEHAVFHNLFDHIETVLPRLKTLAEVKSLAALLESVLRAHSATEDELLIEPLEHCFEQIGQRDTFHGEHEEIDETLRALQKAGALRTARRLLHAAVASSRKHFDKEERIVFPMAERVLNARTLSALGDKWLVRRSEERD